MATYSTDVTNPTPLTAAETVTITDGAVVTITDSNWTANGAGLITITFGKLLVQNTSTSTGMVIKMGDQAKDIFNDSLGTVEVQGNRISIGTGTGGSFTLNGSHTAAVTTITVNEDTAAASTAGQLKIGDEFISYTGKTQYTFTGCTRGVGATAAAAYSSGQAVSQSNSGQTATHWSSEYCPVVWVETAAGSGVYEKYQNLVGFMTTHAVNSLSMIGADKFGRFFTQSGATITFGNGANGKCPPVGANIKVPNIIFTHANASVVSPYYSSFTGAGQFILNNVQMSKFDIDLGSAKLIDFTSCGFSGPTMFNTIDLVEIEDCANGFNYTAVSAYALYCYYVKTLRLTNCSFYCEGNGTYRPIYNYSLFGSIYIDNCFIMQWDNATSTSSYATYLYCDLMHVRDSIIVGCNAWQNKRFDVDGLIMVANPKLVENQTKQLFNVGANILSGKFNNITVPAGGGSNSYFGFIGGHADGVTITNVNIYSTYHQGLFDMNSGSYRNYLIANCYIKDYTTQKIFNIAGAQGVQNIVVQNLTSDEYTVALGSVYDVQFKNVAAASVPTTQYRRSLFHQIVTGATTGAIALRFGIPSEWATDYVTFSGKTAFNASGQMWMPALNDQAILVYPYKLLGITSFQNVAPTISGVNTGNFTLEYAIDTGSGYGAWTALNETNLSAETVDETAGFNIKFRITCNTANSGNYLNGMTIPTNVDQSVKYPTAFGTLALTGLKTGSEVHVYRASDNVQLASTESTAGSTFTYNYELTGGDMEVYITIGKVGYYWLRLEGQMLGEDGLTVPIFQVIDRNYNNPT